MKIHWNNKGRIILCSVLSALCSLLFALLVCLPSSLQARVTGECSNCHTMHNSQDGQAVAYDFDGTSFTKTSAPKGNLLIYNCLGCHSTTGSGPTGAVPGAPIVYNTSQPGYGSSQPDGKQVGLAAGNFYWTTEASASGQSRGHSLPGIPYVDDTSTPSYQRGSCSTVAECHTTFLTSTSGKRKGCESCHLPAHHKSDSTGGWADADDGYYRFLGPIPSAVSGYKHEWGIRGHEDPDWQETSGMSDHNEYSGEARITGYHSISRHCGGCHYKIWAETCKNFEVVSSPLTKHEATLVLPDPDTSTKYKGYVGYGELSSGPWNYDPKLPIARTNITGSWLVNKVYHSSTDALMCLTCHRAHASPYDKMLRWNNTLVLADPAQGSYYGCVGCHSPDPQMPP